MDFQEFPKVLYKHGAVADCKTVTSQEEEDALGHDWIDEIIDPASIPAAPQDPIVPAPVP